jgi:hypothetical protein
MSDQAAGLAVDFGGESGELLERGIVNVLAIEGSNQLAADLGAGALGVGKKAGEFWIGTSIESLGDVVHRGTGRTIDLVRESKVLPERTGLKDQPDPLVQIPGHLPGFDFFE